MKTRIMKRFSFDASHQLPHHSGQCSRLHGHTYTVELFLEGEIQPVDGRSNGGMLVDFGDIKEIFQKRVGNLDHRFLCPMNNPDVVVHADDAENGYPQSCVITYKHTGQRLRLSADNVVLLPIENTTAELLSRYMLEALRQDLPELITVRVWETPTAWAETSI